jgi:MGT family glycosyltransferase
VSRILAYTSPDRGNLFPLIPILDELKHRGHEIAIRTMAAGVPVLAARGLRAAPIAGPVEAIEQDDYLASNPRAALARSVRVFCARAEFEAPDLRQAIEQERPDALIVDVNSWGGLAAAEAWGGPWATFCPYPIPVSSRDTPPFGPGLRPASGPLGRLRDRLLRPVVLGTLEKTFLPGLNRVRRQVDLAPVNTADELYLRPPLILYMTAEPFEYPRTDWPESIVMVGPCEWEPDSNPPAWLDAITNPIVLVSTSSAFQNDARLIQAAIDGLAGEPFTVIATVPAGDPGSFRLAPNARVERFIPHGPVLMRAVCAITHGGMGVTQKALARGVPVCAVPFGRDQLEVARRVEVAGAGTRLPAKRLTPARLRRKVREAMERSEGARRVAAGYRRAGGPPAAATAIETRLLSGTGAR